MDRSSTREIGRVARRQLTAFRRARANCTALIYRPRPACESCCDLASAPARSQATDTSHLRHPARCVVLLLCLLSCSSRSPRAGLAPGAAAAAAAAPRWARAFWRLAVSGADAQGGGRGVCLAYCEIEVGDVQRAACEASRPGQAKRGGPSLCDTEGWESSAWCPSAGTLARDQ